MVDEPGRQELADHGWASADADVLSFRSLASLLERLGRRRGHEVERGAALHLDRGAGVVGEDEDRRVERRVGAPPAFPFGVLVPAGIAELPGTHDLGADPLVMQSHPRIVDPAVPAGLTDHLVPPAGDKHPLVQPVTGVAERLVAAQTFAGPESVERDGEELDAGE